MFSFARLLNGVCGVCNTVTQTVRAGYPFSYGQTLTGNSNLVNTASVISQYTGLITRCMASLIGMHRHGGRWVKVRPNKNPLGYNVPFAKGVVIRPIVRKPKKPNSANRKCVLIRLSNGKETVAYVPKEGHNLQEHNIVLVRVGKLKDCPGVKLRCVRGKYDLPHVEKKTPL